MSLASDLLPFAGAIGVGVFGYLGARFTARNTKETGKAQVEVEQRKVDQSAFNQFVARYEQDNKRLQGQIEQATDWLVVALRHIRQLRIDMINNRPLTPFPDELKNIPLWLLSDELDDGGDTQQHSNYRE